MSCEIEAIKEGLVKFLSPNAKDWNNIYNNLVKRGGIDNDLLTSYIQFKVKAKKAEKINAKLDKLLEGYEAKSKEESTTTTQTSVSKVTTKNGGGREMAYVPNNPVKINGKYYKLIKELVDEIVGPKVATSKYLAFSKAAVSNLVTIAGKYKNGKITMSQMTLEDAEAEAERILTDYYLEENGSRYGELDEEAFVEALSKDRAYKELVGKDKAKLAKKLFTEYTKARSSHALAHEYIHAGAKEFMDANPEHKATKKIHALYEEALENEELIAKDMLATGATLEEATYWKENVDEFLAEALTNPRLMAPLQHLKSKQGKNRLAKVLKELVDTALGMLGIVKGDSIYENVLDGYMAVVEAQRRKDKEWEGIRESVKVEASQETSNIMNQEDNGRTAKFDKKLHKKVEQILRKLYPEIKLTYTEDEIRYVNASGNVMNQEEASNLVKYTLKVVDTLYNIAEDKKQPLPKVRLNSKDKPNVENTITNRLQKQGVPKEQIEYMFDYMKQNGITEISPLNLAKKLTLNLNQLVKLKEPGDLLNKEATFLKEDIEDIEEYIKHQEGILSNKRSTKEETEKANKIISKAKEDLKQLRKKYI